MTNPYAPPQAAVRDIVDPSALSVPADRGTRFGAVILDSIIFSAMVYMPLLFGMLVGGGAETGTASPGLGFVLALIGLIVWCWVTVRDVRRNGQSIAKKILSIKVVRTDGSPITLGRLFWLRNVINMLLSVVPLYGLIDALFIFGESRQCLHDKIADTIVVHA